MSEVYLLTKADVQRLEQSLDSIFNDWEWDAPACQGGGCHYAEDLRVCTEHHVIACRDHMRTHITDYHEAMWREKQ